MQVALQNWFARCLMNVMSQNIRFSLVWQLHSGSRKTKSGIVVRCQMTTTTATCFWTIDCHLLIFIIIMYNNPHLLLGRIRLLNRCIECLKRSESMPESLCYVPKEVCYKVCKDSSFNSSAPSGGPAGGTKTLIPVFENPLQTPHIKKLCKYNIELKKGTCIRTTGEEYRNSQGLWVKITKVNFMYSLWIFSQIIPFTHFQWMTSFLL